MRLSGFVSADHDRETRIRDVHEGESRAPVGQIRDASDEGRAVRRDAFGTEPSHLDGMRGIGDVDENDPIVTEARQRQIPVHTDEPGPQGGERSEESRGRDVRDVHDMETGAP